MIEYCSICSSLDVLGTCEDCDEMYCDDCSSRFTLSVQREYDCCCSCSDQITLRSVAEMRLFGKELKIKIRSEKLETILKD